MKALTKGQYEVLGAVLLQVGRDTHNLDILSGWNLIEINAGISVLDNVVKTLADQFQESDPEFKRELFLAQCGVTE